MIDVNDLPWPRHLLDQHSHTPRTDMLETLSQIHWAGAIPISDLAQDVGLSMRRLFSLFDLVTDLSPKQVARIACFDHAKDLVQSGAQLSDVAVMAGYSDQAHLSREWKSMTGWTLRQAKADFPLLLDADTLPGLG